MAAAKNMKGPARTSHSRSNRVKRTLSCDMGILSRNLVTGRLLIRRLSCGVDEVDATTGLLFVTSISACIAGSMVAPRWRYCRPAAEFASLRIPKTFLKRPNSSFFWGGRLESGGERMTSRLSHVPDLRRSVIRPTSARNRTWAGIVRPSAFATFRPIASARSSPRCFRQNGSSEPATRSGGQRAGAATAGP